LRELGGKFRNFFDRGSDARWLLKRHNDLGEADRATSPVGIAAPLSIENVSRQRDCVS
jgi:hypothetical protein